MQSTRFKHNSRRALSRQDVHEVLAMTVREAIAFFRDVRES